MATSLTSDPAYEAIRRDFAFCAHCGSRMREIRVDHPPVYDRRTGAKTQGATLYWGCPKYGGYYDPLRYDADPHDSTHIREIQG